MKTNKENSNILLFTVYDKVIQFENTLNSLSTINTLERLKNSIGNNFNKVEYLWKDIFNCPVEKEYSTINTLNKEEKAAFMTLQIYGLHQHRNNKSVNFFNDFNLGDSLNIFRQDLINKNEDILILDKKFTSMISCKSILELSIELNYLICRIRHDSNIKINYKKLCEDLYLFQYENKDENREKVYLNWSQSYL